MLMILYNNIRKSNIKVFNIEYSTFIFNLGFYLFSGHQVEDAVITEILDKIVPMLITQTQKDPDHFEVCIQFF